MKILLSLLIIVMATTANAQFFEGKITYANVCSSNIPGITDEQLNTMMGTKQEYFIKDGNYKSVVNGTVYSWQLYVNKVNKLYTKALNRDTVVSNDAAITVDSVIKITVNKNVTEILGYKCDEVILYCNSGVQKYYFNSGLKINTALFMNHKFGNWYAYLSKANAVPLKMITEDSTAFNLVSTAIEVKPMKLNEDFFALPAEIKKSTY